MSYRFATSESVTEGHPDKLCDAISDGILDAVMEADPMGRVACETIATTGMVLVMGEMSAECYVDIPKIARETIKNVGYCDAAMGFDYKTCSVLTSIGEQSDDIALGVNRSLENKSGGSDPYDLIGAGDQGMVYGYACSDTPEFMPMPILLAHRLTKRLANVRKSGSLPFLWPDGKVQVTIAYENGKPAFCPAVIVSSQHNPDISMEKLREAIYEEVIKKVIPAHMLTDKTKYYINSTGRFVVGGPRADSGLTGRKIIADTYGGQARHGGGAYSGKDPTKVDRSASYMARYIAKNLVAAGVASRLEVEIDYAIGVARPVAVNTDSFGTAKIPDEKIGALVNECFDLRPAAIIDTLKLRAPIYSKTTNYGHFGREDCGFVWEKTDRAALIKSKI